MIEFNLNQYIAVQLTPEGKGELERQYNELRDYYLNALPEYQPPREDCEGWSIWQGHIIFNALGSMLAPGGPYPFKPVIRILNQEEHDNESNQR